MNQVHVVRHKVLVEGRSQRAVARELGLARVMVRQTSESKALCGIWDLKRTRRGD